MTGQRKLRIGLLAAAPLFAGLIGLFVGSESYSPAEVVGALLGGEDSTARSIVLQLRAPRVLLAILIGGGLSLSGAVFQALLRNPLAEPYILGVSGGAAVGAVSVLALGITALGSWLLPLAAFAGALLAIVLVFRVATSSGQALDVRVLLLAGVVVGAFFSAVIAFLLSVSDAETIRSAVLWMMGSLAGAGWTDVSIAAVYTIPTALILMGLARAFNAISVGEETALYLGFEVEKVKRIAFGIASLITAAGVAVAGIIGFVGLVIPHALRLIVGSDHRVLLPLSFLAGAAFLTLADAAARVVLAPVEIPIGVVTAFVGVPVFLVLLRRRTLG